MTGPVDPQRAREDHAARTVALAALHHLRDALVRKQVAWFPVGTAHAAGHVEGLDEAITCVDQAIARRGGAK